MVHNIFDKKFATLANESATATYIGARINSDVVSQNQQLVEELHKPITRKFKHVKYIHPLKTIFGFLI